MILIIFIIYLHYAAWTASQKLHWFIFFTVGIVTWCSYGICVHNLYDIVHSSVLALYAQLGHYL